MQNIEIKYRLDSLERLSQRLTSTASIHIQYRHYQKDVYFDVAEGRLKIRLEENKSPCLIRYNRPDKATARISNYSISYPEKVSETYLDLKMQHGVLVEVEKVRELHLYKNVRIHLDEVTELGAFVEFESVISEACDYEDAKRHLDEVMILLGDALGAPQSVGYMNLLMEKQLETV